MRGFKISKENYTNRSDNVNRYLSDISGIPVITPDEEYELAVLAKGGCEKSRIILVESNLRFAVSVAKAYQGSSKLLDLSDLINEANLGLSEASYTFEPDLGFKFISHAIWSIRRRIYEALGNSKTIRIPSNKVQALRHIGKMQADYLNTNGRLPTSVEVQEFMRTLHKPIHSTILDIEKMLNSGGMITALDKDGIGDEDTISPIDYVSSSIDSYSNITEIDSNVIIDKLLKKLKPFERQVVCMRLGIDNHREYSFKQIKYELGLEIGEEAIRIVFRKALRRIKVNNLNFINNEIY
tara:strand:- start:399 stop:1286 length:888 start_codon:yes stop_codon:yes gene_type:complete